ncbi:MAG TPA: OB-fold domain-containing protein [Acidimicrobiia bacterium]|nr:OB-fold domain-containing protein [Acidimicrobiia bacterium]
MTKTRVPAVDGWFTTTDDPALLGARGVESGSYFFPPALAVSANPVAPFEDREPVELSRRGVVWSFTTNHYEPPPPYVAPDPFVPYTVVAVELPTEQMVVLGLLADGVDPAELRVGGEVELVLGVLSEDDDHEYVTWKWRPVASSAAAGGDAR